METALQARQAGSIDHHGFEKAHATLCHVGSPVLPLPTSCLVTSSVAPKQPPVAQDPFPTSALAQAAQEEEECMVDSQPICFSENPFLVANRKSKSCPPERCVLSGPPTGYGRQGQLQTCLYGKASRLGPCFFFRAAWHVTASYKIQFLTKCVCACVCVYDAHTFINTHTLVFFCFFTYHWLMPVLEYLSVRHCKVEHAD